MFRFCRTVGGAMFLIGYCIKVIAWIVFCLVSSYVLLFGKEKTGIKIDYVFTSVILLGVIVVL